MHNISPRLDSSVLDFEKNATRRRLQLDQWYDFIYFPIKINGKIPGPHADKNKCHTREKYHAIDPYWLLF